MKFIIAKGGTELPQFWGRNGWVSNSHWASRYKAEEQARNVIKILALENEIGIRVEVRDA